MLYFFYALSCMLSSNSIAIVYMLFLLGVFSKIMFVLMYTKLIAWWLLFLVLGMCFVKSTWAPSLFDIVKGGVYFSMIVVSFMKFGFPVHAHVYGYWYPCLLLSLFLIVWMFIGIYACLCQLVVNCDCFLACLWYSTLVNIPFWRCQRGKLYVDAFPRMWIYPMLYIVMLVFLFGVVSCMLCFEGD